MHALVRSRAVTALRARSIRPALVVGARLASSDVAHGEHGVDDHHHHEEDTTEYPKETFFTPTFRNLLLLSLGLFGLYKVAPSAGSDNAITQFLERFRTPEEVWQRINDKHLALSQAQRETNLVFADALKPAVQRYRHPQRMEMHSRYGRPVGQHVDISNVVAKGDRS